MAGIDEDKQAKIKKDMIIVNMNLFLNR